MPAAIHRKRPRRRKVPFDAGIEATGAPVVETQPIPEDKNAGEEKHSRRRGMELHFSSSLRNLYAGA